MNAKPKKKLCWNCEGSTAFQDEHCPYCGVSLTPLSIGDSAGKENLFAPPYRLGNSKEEKQIPSSPYAEKNSQNQLQEEKISLNSTSQSESDETNKISTDEIKTYLIPLVLLMAGTLFLIFGLALILFSNNETLTLRWDATYWYAYFLLAMPMLFLGWRSLMQLNDE